MPKLGGSLQKLVGSGLLQTPSGFALVMVSQVMAWARAFSDTHILGHNDYQALQNFLQNYLQNNAQNYSQNYPFSL